MDSENDYNKTYLSTPSTISAQTPHLITIYKAIKKFKMVKKNLFYMNI